MRRSRSRGHRRAQLHRGDSAARCEKLTGRWDDRLPKMCRFWGSLVLGTKTYRGTCSRCIRRSTASSRSISAWLFLFLDPAETCFEPAAAVRVLKPALHIAQSLQLSHFGWDYAIPS